jgi:ATP-dependent protease ClpP protease subunit
MTMKRNLAGSELGAGEHLPAMAASSLPAESALADWLEAQMFERRVVWIRGCLDELVATAVATQLMTLDGSGEDPIQLHLNSGEGTLAAALTLMDTIAALGVSVQAVCSGRAEGPALGVLAVCQQRQAGRHARLRLFDGAIQAAGSASAIAQELAQHQRQLEHFVEAVAGSARQPAERVEIDLREGRYFDVDEALQYRLIDAIWSGPSASAR